jgi:hypothetical protein
MMCAPCGRRAHGHPECRGHKCEPLCCDCCSAVGNVSCETCDASVCGMCFYQRGHATHAPQQVIIEPIAVIRVDVADSECTDDFDDDDEHDGANTLKACVKVECDDRTRKSCCCGSSSGSSSSEGRWTESCVEQKR